MNLMNGFNEVKQAEESKFSNCQLAKQLDAKQEISNEKDYDIPIIRAMKMAKDVEVIPGTVLGNRATVNKLHQFTTFWQKKIQTRVLYCIIKALNKNYTKRDEFVSTAYYT